MKNLFLNKKTQCEKHFFKHSDLFFSSKFILWFFLKIWFPFKNKFQHRRKIGLQYLLPLFLLPNSSVISSLHWASPCCLWSCQFVGRKLVCRSAHGRGQWRCINLFVQCKDQFFVVLPTVQYANGKIYIYCYWITFTFYFFVFFHF